MKLFDTFATCLAGLLIFGHMEHGQMQQDKDQSSSTERMDENALRQSSSPSPEREATRSGGRPSSWAQWMGRLHFILLHFPIALIIMTGVSEILLVWYQRPIFDAASRFMINSAAVLSVPTAVSGLINRYATTYHSLEADLIWWHMLAGIATAIVAIFVAILRKRFGTSKFYYICFIALFLLVNIASYLGGAVTFGPY